VMVAESVLGLLLLGSAVAEKQRETLQQTVNAGAGGIQWEFWQLVGFVAELQMETLGTVVLMLVTCQTVGLIIHAAGA